MSVAVTHEGHVAVVTLQRPDVLNAMNPEVFDGLARAADEIASEPDVRVAIVRGEGRSFSSGIDTTSFGDAQGDPERAIARAQSGFRKIAALEVPVVAAVRGHALGAGLQLALACDLRVVARDASLGLLEARYGLVPDLGGTQRLPRLVGPSVAKRMIWLAERIDGVEAERIGIADVVVEADEVDAAARELAERIAAAPPLAARQVKRLVELSATRDLASGMDEEAVAQKEMLTSRDFAEAVAAFVEKRNARFVGR